MYGDIANHAQQMYKVECQSGWTKTMTSKIKSAYGLNIVQGVPKVRFSNFMHHA